MLRTLFSVAVCSVALFANASANPVVKRQASGDSAFITINSGGLSRDYLLSVPASYTGSSAVPLIFSFHGRGEDATYQQKLTGLSNPAVNPNAIVAYPNGVANDKGTRQFQGDPDSPASVNDIQFTLDIIAQISAAYKIDPKKIYSSGKSNGGALTNLLACDAKASALFAAYASVSGAFYLTSSGAEPACNPSKIPTPIINFHGAIDDTIFYNGGENTRGNGVTEALPAWYDAWATRDGIAPASAAVTTLCSSDKLVTRSAWSTATSAEVLIHYKLSNFKHDWPSTTGNDDGPETSCFDATTLIVDFFGKHSLP